MRRRFWITAAALAAVGCGPSEPTLPKMEPVSGRVTLAGKPLAGARVTFHPLFDVGPRKFAPSAVSGADGGFRLSSASADDGAPAGDYAVTVVKPLPRNAEEGEPERDALGGKYADPAKPPLRATVRPGANELPPLDLK